MKIRRFVANDMRSALANVSAELGADAAILSSNKINGGVEVIAATDYEESLLQPRLNQSAKRQGDDVVDHPKERSPSSLAPSLKRFLSSCSDASQSFATATKRENANGESNGLISPSKETDSEERFPPPNRAEQLAKLTDGHNASANITPFPQLEWSQEPTLVAMREELNMLRSLLQHQVAQITGSKRLQESPLSAALEQELFKLGLSSNIINPIIEQCEQHQDFDSAWQKALGLIAKSIHASSDSLIEQGGIIALVGPTGVGKTTTLAKLAAQQVLKNGPDSLGLITADNYRIAAHEQLRTYGKILQVPVRTVDTEQSLQDALFQFSDRRLILIDTAGMSSQNEQLQQWVTTLNTPRFAIDKYLVLSATSQEQVLKDSLQLFAPFDLSGSIITKLDEAASLGEVLSTIITHKLNVAYSTDGQRVPEDIRVARAHHLVSKMVWLARQREEQRAVKTSGVA